MASKITAAAWRIFSPFTLHSPCSISALNIRQCSSKLATKQDTTPKRSPFRPAVSSTHDWIGPPNPLSNLRPIVYHIPENESDLQKRLRHLRQETEDWNHDFWTKQNFSFTKQKEEFIISQLKAEGLTPRDAEGRRRSLDSEVMAVFYKGFLDTNRVRHSSYNNEWYRRNFTITMLMARVALRNIWRTVTKRNDKNNSTSTT
ncbi:cytochrome c oxidase assembly factor 8 [Pseudochaenichthys georgianus]|uniref:cytochrome c oxidase assembly factor 8 n=1 Tax=Pseudochaenichthys georgianus TaxID=52239 RepID=UPI00146A6B6A|nr:cytochrome c oxidase assembly factor 8 isoform X2 [Pseudochaenichthys georgianus]